MKLERAKGTRDFSPEEMIIRNRVISEIKIVFEKFGFNPFDTPIIERYDVMTAKGGAGDGSDSVSEIFRLKDQGERDLGLRFELTFQLARYIGMNPGLKMPFRRYQMGPVFRDGPIKAGRFREFWQCDADVIGAKDLIADAENIAMVSEVFKKLDLDINIEINSRKLLNDIMIYAEIEEEKRNSVIITIDKLKKIGTKGVSEELKEKGIKDDKIKKIINTIYIEGTNKQKLDKLKKMLGETDGTKDLSELFDYFKLYDIEFLFLPSLARGLGYYTGMIFEVFMKDEKALSSSLAGGGRWDNMIGNYIGKPDNQTPATGISFGLEPIIEVLKQNNNIDKKTNTKIFLMYMGEDAEKKVIEVASRLRESGINTAIDINKRNLGKNMNFANKEGFPFIGIIGDDEIKQDKIKIKDMVSGEEQLLTFKEIVKKLK